MSATQEMYLPTSVKRKLLDIAKKLPADRRTQFIVNTSKEIASFAGEFAKEHKYTIIYGGIGYLVGAPIRRGISHHDSDGRAVETYAKRG